MFTLVIILNNVTLEHVILHVTQQQVQQKTIDNYNIC